MNTILSRAGLMVDVIPFIWSILYAELLQEVKIRLPKGGD
jgi:hypothetical protein